jgi:hypothetical protein
LADLSFFRARYATDRSWRVSTLLLAMAWIMALAISLPIYVEFNGFSNWVRRVNRCVSKK